jgi:hypothetical protein
LEEKLKEKAEKGEEEKDSTIRRVSGRIAAADEEEGWGNLMR